MSVQNHTVSTQPETEAILSVDSLDVEFVVKDGRLQALRDVSITIRKGETLGIAGESGSGKSTLALAVLQYLDSNAVVPNGTIVFKGQDLAQVSFSELQSIRGGEIAHIAQNATTALNPSMTIGVQIKNAVKQHQDLSSGKPVMERVYDVLDQVNIPDPADVADRYPNELSGGQQQRALIAIALSCQPELLIMDEPTTGLDVTTQAKLLDLIEELKRDSDMAIMLITHNLSVIAQIADRVNILYAGEMLETGPVDKVFRNPSHPYTQALLATSPEMGKHKQLKQIPGQIPDLVEIPTGCIFAERCDFVSEECHGSPIQIDTVSPGHSVRCIRPDVVRNSPITASEIDRRISTQGETLLEAKDIHKDYDPGTFFQKFFGDHQPVQAVQGVNLSIREGETVGLVGESGCGKSTLGRLLLGLHAPTEGTVEFRGTELESLSGDEKRAFHKEVQIIFQDPDASLNPRKTVRQIIGWPLKKFTDLDADSRIARIDELLDQVNLNSELKSKYPHELSGGQQQRVSIARAFAADPSVIILDEPVSSLDVSVQASVLNLLSDLRDQYNTSYLIISHDMGVIETIADRLAVMYLGKTVETGLIEDVLEPPYHPYTRSLLTSIPSLDPKSDDERIHLEGDVPSPRSPPDGCYFHTRCPQKIGEICETDVPHLEVHDQETSHCISCHLDDGSMSKPVDTPEADL